MKFSQIALLSAATIAVAQPHAHNHAHHHARHASPVEGRDAAVVVETVAGPVATVYELNGQDVSAEDVAAGIKSGKYVLLGGDDESSASASSSIAPPSTAAPSSTSQAAQFFEKPSSSTTPTSTYVAPTTSASSSAAAASTSSAAAAAPTTPGGDVGASFPSGTIPCSTFPSAYGAVYLDWLGLSGWSGIQNVPNYSPSDGSISYISTGVSGDGCKANSFCSYACPPGYQKSQWPAAQGNTGQSIGGLYCNSQGMLELSRPSVSQICTPGVGNVNVQNKLGQNVAICRTDYPGTESETIPLNALGGQTYPLTCPDANSYYSWKNLPTSAQYYINPAGVSESDACQWGTAGSNIGNWAPVNMGVGKGASGGTFISLFPNAPTNPDGVLNFSIEITGGVSGSCSYTGGMYYSNGVASPTGCTVGVTGTATFVFS